MEPGVEFWNFWLPGLGTRGALWLRHVACALGCVCMCECVKERACGFGGPLAADLRHPISLVNE